MEDEFGSPLVEAEDNYRSMIKLILEEPSYVLNDNWDLENIGHDAQFSSHLNIRQYAIELFGLIGAKVRPYQIETYLLEIENTDDESFEYEFILAHIRVSTAMCSKRAIDLITTSSYFKTWQTTQYPHRFRTILRAIGESKSEIFLDLLHQLAEQKEYEGGFYSLYTEYLLHAIKTIGSNRSEQTILSILESCEDFNVVNQLILTLGYVGDSESISKLRDVIFSFDMNSEDRYEHLHPVAFASCSLGRLNDIESIDRMIELWNNGYKSSYIARAFSLLKYDKAIPILIEGTGDTNANVVVGSLRALGDFGDKEAKSHLLYLQRKGIIDHIYDINPELRHSIRGESAKYIRYALLLVLDGFGESVGTSRLERARDYSTAIWEFDD
jgi:hypothetical protein